MNLWVEAIKNAHYFLHRVPIKKTIKTPNKIFMGKRPRFMDLNVWGCLSKKYLIFPLKANLIPKLRVSIHWMLIIVKGISNV